MDDLRRRRGESENSLARQMRLSEGGGAERRGVEGRHQLVGRQEDANRDRQARWDA
jgi:hypothetical protein